MQEVNLEDIRVYASNGIAILVLLEHKRLEEAKVTEGNESAVDDR